MKSPRVDKVLLLDVALMYAANKRQEAADDPVEAERIDHHWKGFDEERQKLRRAFTPAEDVEYELRRHEAGVAAAE